MRNIVVDGIGYLWKFTFDYNDMHNDSYVIIKSADKKGKPTIFFRKGNCSYGYCPFHFGLPATFQGEDTIINLNQPKFIAGLIRISIKQLGTGWLVGTHTMDHGIRLLHEMGYQFYYQEELR